MKRYLQVLIVILAFGSLPVLAQESEEQQPEPAWTGSLGLSWLATSGNTDTSSLGLDLSLTREPDPWGLEFVARGNRADQAGNLTAENYLAAVRAMRKLSVRWDAFGGLSYAKDTFAGFDSQIVASAGVTYKALLGPKHLLAFDMGLSWTTEDVVPPYPDVDFVGGLFGLAWEWKLSDGAKLTERLVFTPNFDDSEDWRLGSMTAIEASVNEWLALRLGFDVRYRNLPIGLNKNTDTTSTASVVFTF
jgi:putative salt-induced outer membrane protein